MLKIFYGSQAADKEKFIFDSIDPDRKTIIIVPDQYSLQMEKNALEYFSETAGRTALLNLMVADFNSLGNKVARQAGGKSPELIDKYGRHMLLSLVISRLAKAEQLGIYRKMEGRSSFISGANQMISEMKRYGVSGADLQEASEKSEGFLRLKLQDFQTIFDAYEEAIEGRFTDTEDYMSFYGKLMENSELIRDADIWVYGFDTFTPLHLKIMGNMLTAAEDVNVVMTCEYERKSQVRDARILTTGEGDSLFDLTQLVIKNLKDMAEGTGKAWSLEEISGPEVLPLHEAVLVEATNIYAEADRVAAHIMDLVRDRGFRYGDITVICNDMDTRGDVLKRSLDRWGIPAFLDRKRRVLHQPVVRFVLSFMDVITQGYDGDAIMEMLSSGLLDFSREDEELLMNYVRDGAIRGSKWKRPFNWKGQHDRGSDYSPEELERLNAMRECIVGISERAREEMGRRNTASEKITGFYEFLEKDFEIRKRIGQLIQQQKEMGLAEGAAETAQSWNMICSLFSQILRVIGEENISGPMLKELLAAGLGEMEIGLVPSSSDCVIIGTLQRSRVKSTRSLIVTGANEGILPMAAGDKGLFTHREIDALEEMQYSITKKESVRMAEEQLAIYRMFSLPSEDLFVSYSLADQEGKSISPSGIVSVLKEEGSLVLGDLKDDEILQMIASPEGSMTFLSEAIRGFLESGEIAPEWLDAMNWYRENRPEMLKRIRAGLAFSNRNLTLGQELADSLYFGDREAIYASASRLEKYSGCPFRHFLDEGLGVHQPRKFGVDAASRGDIYHKALQLLAKSLMPEEGMSVTDPDSPWMTVTQKQCRERVAEILKGESREYREGIYVEDGESRLQLQRIIEGCGDMAWAMISQIRKSKTRDMKFEESFGYQGSLLKPMEIELENGRKAVLVGRIDRVDYLDAGTDEEGNPAFAMRVIDYKTGSASVSREHIEKGYKLQLMTYMNAVAGEGAGLIPAGSFYFKISDLDSNADSDGVPADQEELENRIAKGCRLEGMLVGDEGILHTMDGTIQPGVTSSVIPVKQIKDGSLKSLGDSEMMSPEEFRELCSKTMEQVDRICHEIQEGRIDIAPKKEKKKGPDGQNFTSCKYCNYRSICLFDTSFRDCSYEMV